MIRKFTLILAILLAVPFGTYAAKPPHAGKPGGGSDGGGGGAIVESVCLDPGHGGSDPGTVASNFKESELNLAVAYALKAKLESSKINVHMTRTDDSYKSNNNRYTFCNTTDATTLISIHHNGSTNADVDYTLGLYHQSNSLSLANTVARSVASTVDNLYNGVSKYPSGVLIKSKMPSMISEGYFLTSGSRLAQLNTNYLGIVDQEAQGLHDGIRNYYSSQ